ncbi:hypothetical protein P692DRAFT_20749798 [Suillus brevipes Sb2]|nr:hypothetical protein P692DRAFT_20749798 [Suillus brevipes Sb2]
MSSPLSNRILTTAVIYGRYSPQSAFHRPHHPHLVFLILGIAHCARRTRVGQREIHKDPPTGRVHGDVPQLCGDVHNCPFGVLTWPVASAFEICGPWDSSTIYFVSTACLFFHISHLSMYSRLLAPANPHL